MRSLRVVLHDCTRGDETDPAELADYLKATFEVPTQLTGDFWTTRASDLPELSRELVSIRVLDPARNELNPEPLSLEVDFEKRRLKDVSVRSAGTLYDATRLMGLYWDHLQHQERSEDWCHIVLTRELFGTWDSDDLRWHARPIIMGYPSLISTTGVVEGPARPRSFYAMTQAGMDAGLLKREMHRDIIDYEDERLTDILKGLCAQALYHHMTGEGFCSDAGCRLYNAHWQKEMIYAQIESPYEFCARHTEVLAELVGERRGGI